MPPESPDTVEHWALGRLIPYARNARTHSDDQVAQIAASIVEFGWLNPVLIDDAANVIAGHGRLLAAVFESANGSLSLSNINDESEYGSLACAIRHGALGST